MIQAFSHKRKQNCKTFLVQAVPAFYSCFRGCGYNQLYINLQTVLTQYNKSLMLYRLLQVVATNFTTLQERPHYQPRLHLGFIMMLSLHVLSWDDIKGASLRSLHGPHTPVFKDSKGTHQHNVSWEASWKCLLSHGSNSLVTINHAYFDTLMKWKHST